MIALRLVILFLALGLDRLIGDPHWLWAKLPHPVVVFGKAISFADKTLNRADHATAKARRLGVLTIFVLVALSLLVGLALEFVLSGAGFAGIAVAILAVAVLLAQKSLADHVKDVADGLASGGLEGGRHAVSMIVGRDPASLDEAGVCRASIESLAENFSDGVVAPAFWYLLLGLPGLFAYKMINTADSMIGHKNEKYLHFGWASARLDDLVNLAPARISAFLIAGGAYFSLDRAAARRAAQIALKDHGLHRSPNSGWPEASMAGALDLKLAGPRLYKGELVNEPFLNAAGKESTKHDIGKAIAIFYKACALLMAVLVPLLFTTLL